MRRAKASLIYNATGNLRAVQILLGHSNIENIVRYLGVDIDDAITQAERTEIWTAQLAGAAGSRLLNYERMAALSGSVIVAVRPESWRNRQSETLPNPSFDARRSLPESYLLDQPRIYRVQ